MIIQSIVWSPPIWFWLVVGYRIKVFTKICIINLSFSFLGFWDSLLCRGSHVHVLPSIHSPRGAPVFNSCILLKDWTLGCSKFKEWNINKPLNLKPLNEVYLCKSVQSVSSAFYLLKWIMNNGLGERRKEVRSKK